MNNDLEIVGGLGSHLAEERRAALERIEDIGPQKALRLLLDALSDEKRQIRKTAVDALKLYPDRTTVLAQLIPLLGDASDANTRNGVIEILGALGKTALPVILLGMENSDPRIRKLSADALGKVDDPKAEERLISAIKDEDENVRLAAAEALGNFKTDEAFKSLLAALKSGDMALKFCAMESLSLIDFETPIDEIRPLLDQKILRRAALDALGASSSPEAVRLLVAALIDPSHTSRNAAVKSLGRIHYAQPHLKKVIVDDIKKALQSDDVLKALLDSMDDPNPEVRRGAIRMLGSASNAAALPKLVEAARDADVEADAYEAVRKIAEKHAEAVEKSLPPKGDPLRESLQSVLSLPTLDGKPRTTDFTPKTNELTQAQFASFRNHVHEFCGIFFKDEMKFLLEKRLFKRLEALQIPTFAEYLDRVMNTIEGKKEIREIINILTTNETYFFREKFQLKALAEEILPKLREEKLKRGTRKLRILSAGCSTGEEPYTVAIILKETGLFQGWEVKIIGCDIADRVLERARKGIYPLSAFRSVGQEIIDRYFSKINAEEWLIEDSVRDCVDFERVNIYDTHDVESIAPFDVILCRNVIIYFDLEAKRTVIDNLYKALEPGGLLLLGHSESLININSRFELLHLKNDMVYRKPVPRAANSLK